MAVFRLFIKKNERKIRMDDEERIKSCQQEIRRLRNVVRYLEEQQSQFEKELAEEIAKCDHDQAGLLRAMNLWKAMGK